MDKLEHIERLRQRANVSYEEAKQAYEAADGDLLEALIILEKQGKVKAPAGNGYYSSEKPPTPSGRAHENETDDENSFAVGMKKFGKFLLNLIDKGNKTGFEVIYEEKVRAKAPVTILVLLVLFLPWVVIPLGIVGLFFGFRYRVSSDK